MLLVLKLVYTYSGGIIMYLQVKDVKKSYGKDTSYIQVLKGVSTGLERGQMCVISSRLNEWVRNWSGSGRLR